jgi:hypothetical protein
MSVLATTRTAQQPLHQGLTEPVRPAVPEAHGARTAPWASAATGQDPEPRAETPLDPAFFALLRCPLTGGVLVPVDADRLMSDRPFRDGVHPVYPVVNGIACLAPVR